VLENEVLADADDVARSSVASAATTTSHATVRVTCGNATTSASVDGSVAVRCMSVAGSTHSAGTTSGVVDADGLSSHRALVHVNVGVTCMHMSASGRPSPVGCAITRASSVATRRVSRSHHSGEHHAHHHTSDESRHHTSLSLLLDDNNLALSVSLGLCHSSLHKHVKVVDLEPVLTDTHLHVNTDTISGTVVAHKSIVIV
jgi:hypothetical protein